MNELQRIIARTRVEVDQRSARTPLRELGAAAATRIENDPIRGFTEALAAPGVSVVDHRVDEGYVTPQEVAGEDPVFVSRIREDQTVENGLNLWVVADNVRKGAALNAVQIAERLVAKDY